MAGCASLVRSTPRGAPGFDERFPAGEILAGLSRLAERKPQ